MENFTYTSSRKTEENKDFINELKKSLEGDSEISLEEAKKIIEKYNNLSSNILAITKEELSDLAKGLGLDESSSLGKTLRKLQEKASAEPTPTPAPAPAEEASPPTEAPESAPPTPAATTASAATTAPAPAATAAPPEPPAAPAPAATAAPPEPPAAEPSALYVEEETPEQISEKLKQLSEYFSISEDELSRLNDSITESGLSTESLSIIPFLEKYKNYIETNLGDLKEDYKEKIKYSIGRRTLKLSDIIRDRIDFVDEEIEEGDYEASDRAQELRNERWNINGGLKDNFKFVDTKLLPSAVMLMKYEKGELQIEEDPSKLYFQTRRGRKLREGMSDEILKKRKIEVTKKMFESDVLEDGDFNRKFNPIDSWDIFDINDDGSRWYRGSDGVNQTELLSGLGISQIEGVSILSEEDEKIEAEAIKYFMFAIATQIAVEVGPAALGPVGAAAGAIVGGTIDIVDVFSDTEVLLDLVQGAGLVDPNYRMKKTWVDNALAGLGLLPGITPLAKGNKVREFLSKMSPEEVSEGMKKVFDAMKQKAGFKTSEGSESVTDGQRLVTLDNTSKVDNLNESYGDFLFDFSKIEGKTIEEQVNELKNYSVEITKLLKNDDIKKDGKLYSYLFQQRLILDRITTAKNEDIPGLITELKNLKHNFLNPTSGLDSVLKEDGSEIISELRKVDVSDNQELVILNNNLESVSDVLKKDNINLDELEKVAVDISKIEEILTKVKGLKDSLINKIREYIDTLKLKINILKIKAQLKLKGIEIWDDVSFTRKGKRLNGKIFAMNGEIRIMRKEGDIGKTIGIEQVSDIQKIDNSTLKAGKEVNYNAEDLLKKFDKLPKSEHVQDLLQKYPHLKPVGGIEIDGHKFLFSEKISFKDKSEIRQEVLGFVEVDGKIESRLFYKSNSDGGWRTTPGEEFGGYSKGKGIDNYHYAVTTKINPDIESYINKEIKMSSKQEDSILEDFRVDEDSGVFGWFHGINFSSMKAKVKGYNDKGVLDHLRTDEINPGHWNNSNMNPSQFKDYLSKIEYPDKFVPDFSESSFIRNYELEHTILGKTNVDVFRGYLDGRKIEWHMSSSIEDPSKVWISNIRFEDGKISSFGNDLEFINSGVLTSKPFEYVLQLPTRFSSGGLLPENKGYLDITSVLDGLKPIQEYKQFKLNNPTVKRSENVTEFIDPRLKRLKEIQRDFYESIGTKGEIPNLIRSNEIFTPTDFIKVNGREFLVTKKIESKPNPYIIGYTKVGDQYEARFFYRSRSGGNWHCSPGVERNFNQETMTYETRISKGEVFGLSYEKGTVVDPILGEKLEDINPIEAPVDITDIHLNIFGDFKEGNPYYGKFSDENSVTILGNNKYEMFGYLDKNLSIDDINNIYRNIDVSMFNFSNFRKIGETKKGNHKYLGETEINSFETILNGKRVQIQYANTKAEPNKVWIENLFFIDTKMNSYGLPSDSINAGYLTTKPIEYLDKDTPLSLKRSGAKNYANGTYIDIRDFIQENPLIKVYKNYSLREAA